MYLDILSFFLSVSSTWEQKSCCIKRLIYTTCFLNKVRYLFVKGYGKFDRKEDEKKTIFCDVEAESGRNKEKIGRWVEEKRK